MMRKIKEKGVRAMMVLRDLKLDENGWFTNGKFDSDSLFKGEMNISILTDDGATIEYAQMCVDNYQHLAEDPEILEEIQEALAKFFLYMYDEWKAMGIYEDIVEDIEPVMEGYKEGRQLIEYLQDPTLYIYPQEGDMIGYGIEAECPWEPEHRCLMLFRENKLLYAAQSEGLDCWGDEEDYYCIWND